jgi:hypothetical protein
LHELCTLIRVSLGFNRHKNHFSAFAKLGDSSDVSNKPWLRAFTLKKLSVTKKVERHCMRCVTLL